MHSEVSLKPTENSSVAHGPGSSAAKKDFEVIVLHPSEMDLGGVMSAVIFYAAALNAAGHPAEIWTPSLALESRAKSMGIPVFFHKGFRNAVTPIVHPSIVARALRAKRHAKAIVHQGEKHWLFGRIWLGGLEECVVFHNEKINYRRLFDHWLAISERHRQALEAFAQERGLRRLISVIRNGPLPDASLAAEPRPVRPIVNIGAISNFGPRKGMDVLIRAFAVALQRNCSLRLMLAGDGFERKACERLGGELGIDGDIEWLGWQWDTRAFFNRIDLFCLPSRKEPFGIVVTEAMQAGLAVIATDTSGPTDIVMPGETGWIVPVEDVTALADVILDAAENPAKTAAFGAAGWARFHSTYSLPAAGKAIAAVLGL
jgi:glycosyltransferase involved in cell wall biosynthesis